MIDRRHGEIFEVRDPIRNVRDKLVDILQRAFFINFESKDSEMNQACE
jgi:hypothetical protein